MKAKKFSSIKRMIVLLLAVVIAIAVMPTQAAVTVSGAEVPPALPSVWVELSQGLEAELQALIGFSDIDIDISIAGGRSGNCFVAADIIFSVPDADLNGILSDELPGILQTPGAYYTIFADLSGLIPDGMNHHRIAALHDGTIIGGGISGQDMVFSAAVTISPNTAGSFEISYVENLRRLALSQDSFMVVDLAGNTPSISMDTRPFIRHNRALVPLRFVAESLGATVGWTGATAASSPTVHLTLDGQTLDIPIGGTTPELTALGMDIPAYIVNNRTMVPLRFIAEFFGAAVNWDEGTRGIDIIAWLTTE